MVGRGVNFKLMKFKFLVTRLPKFGFDVQLRKNIIVLVSDVMWTPPQNYLFKDRFKNWCFGADWKIVVVPEAGPFELVLSDHAERNGLEI